MLVNVLKRILMNIIKVVMHVLSTITWAMVNVSNVGKVHITTHLFVDVNVIKLVVIFQKELINKDVFIVFIHTTLMLSSTNVKNVLLVTYLISQLRNVQLALLNILTSMVNFVMFVLVNNIGILHLKSVKIASKVHSLMLL